MESDSIDFTHILRGVWHYRWYGLVCAWLSASLGIAYVMQKQDVYEASARVYVETSSRLRQLLEEQIVDSSMDQLGYVQSALLGRPTLTEVARRVGLFDESASVRSKALVVDSLRRNISISVGSPFGARRGESADDYIIRYPSVDRDEAIFVVSVLLELFVEDSQGEQRNSSLIAGTFLTERLDEYENRLREAESALAEFNKKNYSRLPANQNGYFANLQEAREELEDTTQALSLVNSRLDNVEEQVQGGISQVLPSGDLNPTGIDARLLAAQQRVDELLFQFTEEHPNVIAARDLYERLKSQYDQAYSDFSSKAASNNPVFQALQITRNELRSEKAALEAERNQKQSKVEELQSLLNEMPEVEAERARLNRDYEVVYNQYRSLLESFEKDKLTNEVVEIEDQEFEFRVIDPPSATTEPISRSRSSLYVLVLGVSLAVGLGVAYVLCEMRPVISSVNRLGEIFDRPVLGTITSFPTAGVGTSNALFFAGVSSLLLVLVGITLAEVNGIVVGVK